MIFIKFTAEYIKQKRFHFKIFKTITAFVESNEISNT